MGRSRLTSYDVIIVGAGPAGATLAYELAKASTKALLLEKDSLPRYKACAGGINVRTANILGFDITSVVERVVSGARLSYRFDYKLTRHYPQPITYMVARDRFDQLLAGRAQEAGAQLLDKQPVEYLEIQAGGIKVATRTNAFLADVVIGADGVRSMVARRLGLARDLYYGLGLESEVYVSGEELTRWETLMGLDIGIIPGGYGWLFPKGDHLSLGVAGQLRFAPRLGPYLRRLMASYHLADGRTQLCRGALMPVRKPGMPISHQRGLLVGDAAGLIDAVTGEGIYYAVRSAQMAAPVVIRFLGGETADLADYEQAVDAELMPELAVTRALERLFTWLSLGTPRLFFNLTAEKERVWWALCRIIRGEKSYISVKRELGPFQFLLDLLSG